MRICYNYEIKNKIAIDTSLRWNHSTDGNVRTNTSSVKILSVEQGLFLILLTKTILVQIVGTVGTRLEWNPDTMTDIMFRPSFTYSTNDSRSSSSSASYNKDPYQYVTDPLSAEMSKTG